MPCSIAVRATASAAICAANGVDYFEPLNPRLPADAHAITLPWLSEIVTMVLLNDEWMCATPDPTFLNSRFLRVLVCFLAAKRKKLQLSCPTRNELGCRRLDRHRPHGLSPIFYGRTRRGWTRISLVAPWERRKTTLQFTRLAPAGSSPLGR